MTRKVYRCSRCSRCTVTSTAGFIRRETYTCNAIEAEVDRDDGCTFGDEDGPTYGAVLYDIDLSLTAGGAVLVDG